MMAKALELIKSNGLPAGIGGHSLDTIKGAVDHGLAPDFWMKTLHSHNYWASRHPERHKSKWCYDPEETIAFMRQRKEPWIAFKTLAAGALDKYILFNYLSPFMGGSKWKCTKPPHSG